MMRSTLPLSTFRNCIEIIEYILEYVDKHDPEFATCLRHLSFKMSVELLHSPERMQSVGSLHYLSIMVNKPKFAELFAMFGIQIINGVFSLMNQLSCKFNLTIHKKSHELAKSVLSLIKKRFTEENKMQQLRNLTRCFVQIIPNNKQYEQKILFNLLAIAHSDLTKKQVYEIMFEDCYTERMEDKKIAIEEILNSEKYKETSPPIHKIFEYIFSTLRHYKIMLDRKKTQSSSGPFKELVYEDCSLLTSTVLAVIHMFKLKIAYKSVDDSNSNNPAERSLEPRIEELIEIFRDLIKENEDFNERKMLSRGSSVRPMARENLPGNQGAGQQPHAAGNVNNMMNGAQGHEQNPEAMAQVRTQPGYRPNPDTHYQNLEFKIYADDYDFSVQGWSMLVESIIIFLSSYLSRPDVHEHIKRLRNPGNAPINDQNHEPIEPPLLKIRHAIIYKMFDLFSRVEFRIRDSVERGFTQLIKLELVEKDLIPRENPEICFKPFLCFMQQDNQAADRRASMSETSLYCFMKLLKIFKTCFNTERLLARFRESLTNSEELYTQPNYTPREEETNQISRIFGILGIVLSTIKVNLESDESTRVITQGLKLEQLLQEKGAHSFSLKSKLEDLLNAQTSLNITTAAKKNLGNEAGQKYMNFFLETLKKSKSHQLRERICRENPSEYLMVLTTAETQNPLSIYKWSQIIHILMERLPWSMSQNEQLLKFYRKAVQSSIKQQHWLDETEPRRYAVNSPLIPIEAQQFVLNLKILVLFAENIETGLVEEKISLLFFLVEFCDLKTTLYLNFVKLFFKQTLPKLYSQEKQRLVFLRYLEKYKVEDFTKSHGEICPNDHYFKMMNVYIMLPILNNIFEKGDLETSILFHPQVLTEMTDIIQLISKPQEGKPHEIYPTWWLIEYTIFLDYILAKANFRALRPEKMMDSNRTIQEVKQFLHDLTHFSWKNLVPKQETSKLLVNLSKLLVSRIKSHSDIFDPHMDFIYELYGAILNKNEDVVDEENKNIWISAVDVILPAMSEAAQRLAPDDAKGGLPKTWCEDFLKAMETNFSDRAAPASKEKAIIATRWWTSILKNRELLYPHRQLIIEVPKMVVMVTSMVKTSIWVTPAFFFDLILMNIGWHIKYYKQQVSENPDQNLDNVLRDETRREQILIKLSQDFLIKEDDSGQSLPRIYFLYRLYHLIFDKTKIQFDYIDKMLDYLKMRFPAQNPKDEYIPKKFKTIFVYMNVCLLVLYQPKAHEMRERDPETLRKLFEYLIKEICQTRLMKENVRYTFTIPLFYHIIRRIIKLSDENRQNEYLETLRSKCIESIKIAIVPSEGARANQENPESILIWHALIFCRIIFDQKPDLFKDDHDCIAAMVSMFMKQLFSKKNSKDNVNLTNIGDEPSSYNENQDILDKIFCCSNADTVETRVNIKNCYRGYTILMLRILTRLMDKSSVAHYEASGEFTLPGVILSQMTPQQQQTVNHFLNDKKHRFGYLIEYFFEVLRNANPLDHELKLEVLMMLRCFLVPHTVKNTVYKGLAKERDFLSPKLKMCIINATSVRIETLFKRADGMKPRIKMFMDHLWQLIIDIIE